MIGYELVEVCKADTKTVNAGDVQHDSTLPLYQLKRKKCAHSYQKIDDFTLIILPDEGEDEDEDGAVGRDTAVTAFNSM